MFKITKSTNIYILCPSKTHTGGPEAINQLVFKLVEMGFNARLVFFPRVDNPRQPIYEKYYPNITYGFLDDIEDLDDNILIVPEIAISHLARYINIQKCIWWLSIDNSEKKLNTLSRLFFGNSLVLGFFNKLNYFTKNDFFIRGYHYVHRRLLENCWDRVLPTDASIIHLCQSKYAENWLLNRFARPIIYSLSDYLNSEFIQNSRFDLAQKEDIVAYNPKKGFSFTQKLINYSGDIKFVPIIKMTPTEVQQLLRRAKVYIDFGNHPGKDRIPREAALQGCCIITNTRGSAGFYTDIPIDHRYVFESFNTLQIIGRIRDIFLHFEEHLLSFDNYREIILAGESKFEDEIQSIFKKISDNSYHSHV